MAALSRAPLWRGAPGAGSRAGSAGQGASSPRPLVPRLPPERGGHPTPRGSASRPRTCCSSPGPPPGTGRRRAASHLRTRHPRTCSAPAGARAGPGHGRPPVLPQASARARARPKQAGPALPAQPQPTAISPAAPRRRPLAHRFRAAAARHWLLGLFSALPRTAGAGLPRGRRLLGDWARRARPGSLRDNRRRRRRRRHGGAGRSDPAPAGAALRGAGECPAPASAPAARPGPSPVRGLLSPARHSPPSCRVRPALRAPRRLWGGQRRAGPFPRTARVRRQATGLPPGARHALEAFVSSGALGRSMLLPARARRAKGSFAAGSCLWREGEPGSSGSVASPKAQRC